LGKTNDAADHLHDQEGREGGGSTIDERCTWSTSAGERATDEIRDHNRQESNEHPVRLIGAAVIIGKQTADDRRWRRNHQADDCTATDSESVEGSAHRTPRVPLMTDPEGTEATDSLRHGLRQITAAVTRARYLAEAALVDGEPELAAVLRSMAERNEGLAQGLYALLAEETDTADARPGADDLAQRLPVEAAMYSSLADEIRDQSRPDLAAWMDKMADAQHDHHQRLEEARHWKPSGEEHDEHR